jgi:hypothetical protein
MGAKRTKKRVYVSRMGMGGAKRPRRKRKGGSFLSQANEFIKKHKLISKIAGEVAKSQGPFGQIGKVAQSVAKRYGYGSRGIMTGMGAKKPRKRRGGMMGMGAKRKRRGGSIFSSINDWLKRNKVLSTIGSVLTPMAGSFAPAAAGLTAYAKSQGYGAKKRMHTRRGGNNPYPTTNSFYGKPVF